jgi:hypothetical protein
MTKTAHIAVERGIADSVAERTTDLSHQALDNVAEIVKSNFNTLTMQRSESAEDHESDFQATALSTWWRGGLNVSGICLITKVAGWRADCLTWCR